MKYQKARALLKNSKDRMVRQRNSGAAISISLSGGVNVLAPEYIPNEITDEDFNANNWKYIKDEGIVSYTRYWPKQNSDLSFGITIESVQNGKSYDGFKIDRIVK